MAHACALSGRVARIATRGRFPIGRFSHPARRCRSSVVEHPLGKGEVVSSILTGSTTKKPISSCFRTDLEWLHRELLEFERTLFAKSGLGGHSGACPHKCDYPATAR